MPFIFMDLMTGHLNGTGRFLKVDEFHLHWREMVLDLQRRYALLDRADCAWIATRLERIEQLQEKMHSLFLAGQGDGVCLRCEGSCCDSGRNHFSFVNLLAFIDKGESPPEPDISRPCPFLGDSGCRLEPRRRPYSCLTFLCDEVENHLCEEDLHSFYTAEQQLRGLYLAFDQRYAGSSLRGLFIRAERIGIHRLLDPLPQRP